MPFLIADLFITAREGYRLERNEADLLAVLQRELDDRSDLIVVDGVDDRHDQADVDARCVQVLDRSQLHLEQVAHAAVSVRCLADPVELQVGDAHPGLAGLVGERLVLGEANAVCRGLHAEVAHLPRVANRVEENRRDRGFAAGKLYGHLTPGLDADRVVEQFFNVGERQLVDVPDLIGIHEAGITHHVAAVGQVDRQHRAAAVLDG